MDYFDFNNVQIYVKVSKTLKNPSFESHLKVICIWFDIDSEEIDRSS